MENKGYYLNALPDRGEVTLLAVVTEKQFVLADLSGLLLFIMGNLDLDFAVAHFFQFHLDGAQLLFGVLLFQKLSPIEGCLASSWSP